MLIALLLSAIRMLEAKIITNRAVWEEFVSSQEYALFLQSAHYTTFADSRGEKWWIVGLYEDTKLIGGSLIIGVEARRGRHMMLQYGPLLNYENEKQLKVFFSFIKELALKEGFGFIRFSPFVAKTSERLTRLKNIGCRLAPMHILAEHTWMLDIAPDEQDLFSAMNKNHRNLIHRCEKEGVKITKTTSQVALDELNEMHNVVAKRHRFHRFSKDFIEKEFHALSTKNNAVIFEARLPDGRIDASAIIVFYGNTAAYRHSASLQLDKRLPTSYLIQWEAIKEAKRRGLKWYNFWGIAPHDADKRHPFYGITHFKKGFGGSELELIPCHDIPLKQTYILTRWFEIFRSIRRGFK